jgi:alkylation response protein AidB-like acyl-CoA dehydrogenase
MDFGFSQEEEDFRQEVREFIQKEYPPELRRLSRVTFAPSIHGLDDEGWELMRTLSRKLGAKGWLSLSWPEKYGGQNSPFLQYIVYEEVLYNNCPGINHMGVTFLAPTLIKFGSEEQAKRHLPGIAKGEVYWCELLSEPDSGSDLASIKTQATEHGDYYVINGQKTWSSGAHLAEWGFILVRTAPNLPRHRGLSYFLIDMKTPGITINPITDMLEEDEFCEVFFDEVRVPKEDLIGGKNRGWYVTMATLDFERAAHMYYPSVRGYLDHLIEYVKRSPQPLSPVLRNRLAELVAECEMARWLHYRAIWMMSRGNMPTYEVAIDKLYNSELAQRVAELGTQVLGHYGGLLYDSKHAFLYGWPSYYYLDTVSYTIMAGTSEIDRNVIAQRGLGLPAE